MQFDNPMITFEAEEDPDSVEAVDLDSSPDNPIAFQDQIRADVRRNLNLRSFLHGTFYTALIFVLIVMFLEVEFDILDTLQINGLMALVLVLGGASTIVKSREDDRVYDPNFIPSSNWRFIIYIFMIVGEILLFLLARQLTRAIGIEGLLVLALMVGAVNLAVLWQFTEEEFDDYLDPPDDRRTVVSNYLALIVLSAVLFIVRGNLPMIEPITNVLSLFFFLFYSGFFWSYALFDRETINTLSRVGLSIMSSIMLLPLTVLLLDRLSIPIDATIVIVTNFILCTLGFMAYNVRPRLKAWLYIS